MTKTKGKQAYQESSELKPVWANELERININIEGFRNKIGNLIYALNSTQVELEKLIALRTKLLAERKQPGLGLKA